MTDVRIYCPAKTAMQSGRARTRQWVLEFPSGAPKTIDSLMGWTGSSDTSDQVCIKFQSKDDAIAFATRNGLGYHLTEPKQRAIRPKNYADNFAFDRLR